MNSQFSKKHGPSLSGSNEIPTVPYSEGLKPAAKRQIDTSAPTLLNLDPKEKVEQNNQPAEIEQQKTKTRSKLVYAVLPLSILTGSALTLGAKYYFTGNFFTDSKENTVEVAPSAQPPVEAPPEQEPPLPDEVTKPEHLAQWLEAKNIMATDEDFGFSTNRRFTHAKAALFQLKTETPDQGNLDAEGDYVWEPVLNRIKRVKDQEEVLIAVKITNEHVLADDNPGKFFQPDGLSYRTFTQDPHNPTIFYFYITAEDKVQDVQLAQIGLKSGGKLMWAQSFDIRK